MEEEFDPPLTDTSFIIDKYNIKLTENTPQPVVVEVGKYKYEFWFNSDKKLHREDGPAAIKKNNGESYECWFINGELSNSEKPSFIWKYRSYLGEILILQEIWYLNNKIHRDNDEPAIIMKNDIGTLVKIWYINGNNYRPSGKPSYIEYHNDKLYIERYTDEYGEEHRENGFSSVTYEDNGEIFSSWYKIHGFHVNDTQSYQKGIKHYDRYYYRDIANKMTIF